ncbi:MAG: glycoside hydrolase family 1 protein [Myxococcaceae bacterium]|nr:glycoside hydrolase family 1 protein [Myxococcaceae bacterium]
MKRVVLLALAVTACQPRAGLDDVSADPGLLGSALPRGFLWGTATAAHQIEGGLDNDWSVFEAGSFPDGTPHIRNRDRATVATDSWNRFDDDLAAMKALGSTTYRFSVEWSRLEPRKGEWNDAAMQRYRDWCVKLRANGITPMVTLQHFTLPRWVADAGGFEGEAIRGDLERFTRRVAGNLKDQVDWWVTLNEPNVYAVQGWLRGVFPPGKKDDTVTQTKVIAMMLKTHARMAQALREVDDVDADGDGFATRIAVAHHVRYFQPATTSPLDVAIAALTDDYSNEAIPRALKTGRVLLDVPGAITIDEVVPGLAGSIDVLGLNYYTRDLVRTDLGSPSFSTLTYRKGRATSDLGWDLYPDGLHSFLVRFAAYGWPLVVTENGLADRSGTLRTPFLVQHVHALERALRDGADVRGYAHWSLMDNFEWAEGYDAQFGLFTIEPGTLRRVPTASVEPFRAIGANIPR